MCGCVDVYLDGINRALPPRSISRPSASCLYVRAHTRMRDGMHTPSKAGTWRYLLFALTQPPKHYPHTRIKNAPRAQATMDAATDGIRGSKRGREGGEDSLARGILLLYGARI